MSYFLWWPSSICSMLFKDIYFILILVMSSLGIRCIFSIAILIMNIPGLNFYGINTEICCLILLYLPINLTILWYYHFQCDLFSSTAVTHFSMRTILGFWKFILLVCTSKLLAQFMMNSHQLQNTWLTTSSRSVASITRLPDWKVKRVHYGNLSNELHCSLQYCGFSFNCLHK